MLAEKNYPQFQGGGGKSSIGAAGAGGSGIWTLNGSSTYYSGGNVGIGTSTPAHALSVMGGPAWTANGWSGSLELPNSGALGRQANAGGMRFGMGHSGGGFYLFRTASDPGTAGSTAAYDFVVTDAGHVGINTTVPLNHMLEVVGQNALGLIGYQPYLTLSDANAGYARGRIQSVSGGLNLFTESYLNGANPFSFLTLRDSGNVGIGSATPVSKLEVVSQDALSLIGCEPFLTLKDDSAGYARSRIQGVGGDIILETEGFINGSTPDGSLYLKDEVDFCLKPDVARELSRADNMRQRVAISRLLALHPAFVAVVGNHLSAERWLNGDPLPAALKHASPDVPAIARSLTAELAGDVDAAVVVQELRQHPAVEWASLNLLHPLSHVPNDAQWTNQWGPLRVNATNGWDVPQATTTSFVHRSDHQQPDHSHGIA